MEDVEGGVGSSSLFLVSTEVSFCAWKTVTTLNDMLYKSMFENNDIENFWFLAYFGCLPWVGNS